MILYFANRAMVIAGQASTELPEGLDIIDDLKTEDVETGVATFECVIPFSSNTRKLAESCTLCGNYILRENDGESELYTIIESEIDTKKGEVSIYAEDAGLDLLNEIAMSYEATEAHPIAYYIDQFAYDTGFEIGVNEAADLSRKLKWEGESTITERLASIATQFGCELSYSFKVDGMRLTNKYINIYRKRGEDSGIPLRLNFEIDKIVTSSSITNLATALYPTGGVPENSESNITLNGFEYDDGDIYLDNGYLKSREAVKKWSRYLNPSEPYQNYTGHILRTYSYDTTSQQELCNRAVAELKKICQTEVNYEVNISELPSKVRIGDRVNIIDDEGGLYVSSRIIKLETSVANNKRTATLGEHLIKTSGIHQKVSDLAAEFAAVAAKITAVETMRFFTRYSAYADGREMTDAPMETTEYMGTCSINSATAPTDPNAYTWVKIVGSDGIGVVATYRYYLLQSSTLSWPSKPTVFPPPIPWNDTEPVYEGNSANSLYTVDCTVFSDDTFAYSEVSLSSSYAAAKAAYEEASTARSEIVQLADKISLSVKTENGVASIVIGTDGSGKAGTIDLTGMVTFSNLETSGQTVINADNISTGIINGAAFWSENKDSLGNVTGAVGMDGGGIWFFNGDNFDVDVSRARLRIENDTLNFTSGEVMSDLLIDFGGSVSITGSPITLNGAEPFTKSSVIPIANGGTGATTVRDAANNFYETGTWTPKLICTGTNAVNPTYTLSNVVGYYCRIGKLVHIYCSMDTNITAIGSGYAAVGGLPFAIYDGSALDLIQAYNCITISSTDIHPIVHLGYNGSTYYAIFRAPNGAGAYNWKVYNGGNIKFSGVYRCG